MKKLLLLLFFAVMLTGSLNSRNNEVARSDKDLLDALADVESLSDSLRSRYNIAADSDKDLLDALADVEYLYEIFITAVITPGYNIAVYEHPFCRNRPEIPIDIINQQSGTDEFYSAYILKSSPLRYKVIYQPVSKDFDSDAPRKIGWIDKMDLGLTALEIGPLRLYEQPDTTSNYIEFQYNYYTDQKELIDMGALILLEIGEKHWRKVMFSSEGKNYIGWVNRYRDSVWPGS